MATEDELEAQATAEKKELWCNTLPATDLTDAKAKKLVMDTLNSDAMQRVDFFVADLLVAFTPDAYKQVKLRVYFDDIVVYDRNGVAARSMSQSGLLSLPSDAAYFRDLDILLVKTDGNNIYYQAIVVHECTHALLDMMGSKGKPLSVRTAKSEAVAYIAQAVYARACYQALHLERDCIFVDETDANMQSVFHEAWKLAGKVLGLDGWTATKWISNAELAEIMRLVPLTETYKSKPTTVHFNGIALRPASCA